MHAAEFHEARDGPIDPEPQVLLQALSRPLRPPAPARRDTRPDGPGGPIPPEHADISRLGDYGLDLLARLAALADSTLLTPHEAQAGELGYRAIVATRSHRPALMEAAFESILEYLPDEAPAFFREGMEQIGILSYPPQVRDLMQRFHQQCHGWCVLH